MLGGCLLYPLGTGEADPPSKPSEGDRGPVHKGEKSPDETGSDLSPSGTKAPLKAEEKGLALGSGWNLR